MSFVLDASIALSWCFEDEASHETDLLQDRVHSDGAVVPSLWYLELGNVLLQAEKRNRVSVADVTMYLELVASLPITTDNEVSRRAWGEILTLARVHKLTTYDASYLELAIRLGIPFATRDSALAIAAKNLGVQILP